MKEGKKTPLLCGCADVFTQTQQRVSLLFLCLIFQNKTFLKQWVFLLCHCSSLQNVELTHAARSGGTSGGVAPREVPFSTGEQTTLSPRLCSVHLVGISYYGLVKLIIVACWRFKTRLTGSFSTESKCKAYKENCTQPCQSFISLWSEPTRRDPAICHVLFCLFGAGLSFSIWILTLLIESVVVLQHLFTVHGSMSFSQTDYRFKDSYGVTHRANSASLTASRPHRLFRQLHTSAWSQLYSRVVAD